MKARRTRAGAGKVVKQARPDRIALLVHGIGPFSESVALAGARNALGSQGLGSLRAEFFNWRSIAGDLSGPEPDFLARVASMSRAVQGIAHLQVAGPRTAISRLLCDLTVATAVALPWLALAALLTKSALVWILLAVVIPLHFLNAMASGGLRPLASVLSALLPFAWSALHTILIGPYLVVRIAMRSLPAAALVVTVLCVPLAMLSMPVWSGCLVLFVPMAVWFAVRWSTYHVGNTVVAVSTDVERGGAALLLLMADVIRYVGDPAYRNLLRTRLAERMSALSGSRGELIVVAHSLGSVIAVDVLTGSMARLRSPILLVTMGSPLLRLFSRLLPRQYPPPVQLRWRLLHGGSVKRWVNVFRPQDGVGGRLFGSSSDDRSTGQRWMSFAAPLRAHLDYWRDPVVVATIRQVLRDPPMEEPVGGGDEVTAEIWNGRIPAERAWWVRCIEVPIVAAAIATFALVVWRLMRFTYTSEHGCAAAIAACIAVPFAVIALVGFVGAFFLPAVLSLAGIDNGGGDSVPGLEVSRERLTAYLREGG